MTLSEIIKTGIDPALALLPAKMDTPEARIMLLAIGLQESRFEHRRQIGGPARGFWQFEQGGGVVGVLSHPSSANLARHVCEARSVGLPLPSTVYKSLEHDDVLAAAFARLLLWTDPKPLPKIGDSGAAWDLYLRTWRPGAYERGSPEKRAELRAKWGRNYALAVAEVTR